MTPTRPGPFSFALQFLISFVGWGRSPWGTACIVFVAAWCLMLVLGDPLIDWLRSDRWRRGVQGWTVREDTPESHQAKQGTPSMGGIGIIGVAVAAYITLCLLWIVLGFYATLRGPLGTPGSVSGTGKTPYGGTYPWSQMVEAFALVPIMVGAHALLGFADDYSKVRGLGGLLARSKLIGQTLFAGAFLAAWAWLTLTQPYFGIRFIIPLFASSNFIVAISLLVMMLVLIGTTNAVNLTDGIDGLAAGLAIQFAVALWLCDMNIYEITYPCDLFWAGLAGACLGFLRFNRHPARLFMGDTGSLAIGAAVGVGAILAHAVSLLPFAAFIFYSEMLSVMLQVSYFKYSRRRSGVGQRIFRRAPLHHHCELAGWSERRVVLTFWAVNLAVTVVGLRLWDAGILPRWP